MNLDIIEQYLVLIIKKEADDTLLKPEDIVNKFGPAYTHRGLRGFHDEARAAYNPESQRIICVKRRLYLPKQV